MNPLNTLISSSFEHPLSSTLLDIFENFPTYETSSLSQSSFEKLCRLPLKYSFVSQYYTLGKVFESLFFYRIIEFDSLTANNLLDLQNALTLIINEIKGSFLSESLLAYSEEIIVLIVKKDDINDEDKKTIIESSNRKFPLVADFESNTEEIMFYLKSSYLEDKLFAAQKIYELLFQTNSFDEQLEIASKKLINFIKMLLKDDNNIKEKDEKMEFELLLELCKTVIPLIGESEFNFKINKDEIAAGSLILFESDRDLIGLKTMFEEKIVLHCKIFGFEDYFTKYEQIFTLCALIINYCLPKNLPNELHSALFKILSRIYLIFPNFRQNLKEPLLATIILISSSNDQETMKEIAIFLFNLASKASSKDFLEEILCQSENVKKIFDSEIYFQCTQPIDINNFDLKTTFPFEKSIEAGETYFRLVEVSKPCLIYVGVATQYYDIDVKLSFVRCFEKVSNFEESEVLYKKDAVDASKYPYRIIFFAKDAGLYKIEFSNKKSWFNSKCIRYKFMVLENLEFSEENITKMVKTENENLSYINEEELECLIDLNFEIKTSLRSKPDGKIHLNADVHDIKELSLRLNEFSNSKENFGKKFIINFKVIYNIFARRKIMKELKIEEDDLKVIFSKILSLEENIFKGWRVLNLESMRDIDFYFERILVDRIVNENDKTLIVDYSYKTKMIQAKILDSFILKNSHLSNNLANYSELMNLNYDLDSTYEDKWVENLNKNSENSLNIIEFYADFIYNIYILKRHAFKFIIFSQFKDGSTDMNPTLLNEELISKLKENLGETFSNQMNFEIILENNLSNKILNNY